jgi:mycothiol synthase
MSPKETSMKLVIRPAAFPNDYPAIARVLRAEMGDWAPTPEELAHEDAARDPALYWAVFVAEDSSLDEQPVIGMASVGHDPRAHREGKFLLNIRVPPDLQGRGVGARLYETILSHIEPLAPRELQTDVWETLPRPVRFVIERGFVEAWRRSDAHLDVARFDWSPYAGLEGRVTALGVEVKTYAELEHVPDRLVKLYELDWALWQDVPYGEVVTKAPLEQFAKQLVHDPDFLPDACFIAVKGDEFVGYSHLSQGDGYYNTEMTGVLGPYRGAGIATLLKLRGIRYAQAHDNRELRTVNDSVNTAMLALNAKLGFQRDGGTIRFIKRMGQAAPPAL